MADAGVPRWHGDNYQARIFWRNALSLLDPSSNVVEVTFEADGPKAFDDVVVRYDPPVVRSGPDRISAEYYQVKWHVERGGRFGFEAFVNPAFIGATKFSILERLQRARSRAKKNSQFVLITTYRIQDGDPLADLVAGNDNSLLIEKLFDETTDRSRMGQVRKLWREHLRLDGDGALREIVAGLRILEGHGSLEDLRSEINLRAKLVGLMGCSDTNSDFRYDELARKLKARKLNVLNRETFVKFCREEGLFVGRLSVPDHFLKVAIRSFLGPAADIAGAMPENTLFLIDDFRQRYLRDNLDWQRDIRPKVETFLRASVVKSSSLRLILDAHASIAFLSGSVLDLKSGVEVEMIQKGRVGSRIWRVDDGSESRGALFSHSVESLGKCREIAIAISISQAAEGQARTYICSKLQNVGKLVSFALPSGPGHQNVVGGGHACILAEQVSNILRTIKEHDPDALVHIFAACPNAFQFFLGQHHQSIAPCIVYEFDFDRHSHKTYQPSFLID